MDKIKKVKSGGFKSNRFFSTNKIGGVGVILLLMTIISGCPSTFTPPETESLTLEKEPSRWAEIYTSSWTLRIDPQAVVLGDGILVMGGLSNDNHYLNDVWFDDSLQGTNWNQVNSSSPWSARSDFQAVVLNSGDILLMGGFDGSNYKNDIWLSKNAGTNWNQITAQAPWPARDGFQTVVLNNGDILLMGGFDGSSHKNDIWLSKNAGTNWNQITAQAPWPARSDFQAAVWSNYVLVIGGAINSNTNNPYPNSRSVYLSADGGTNWNLRYSDGWETGGNLITGRKNFQLLVLNNGDIFLLGGRSQNSYHYSVFFSQNGGVSWRNLVSELYGDGDAYYDNGYSFEAVALPNNDILTIGGVPQIGTIYIRIYQ